MKRTFIIVVVLLTNSLAYSQTVVEEPVHVKTEENGVKIYSTNGNENKQESNIQTPEAVQPIAKTLNDFTVEEIDNIIHGLNMKLELSQEIGDQDMIILLNAKKEELIARKKVLTNQN